MLDRRSVTDTLRDEANSYRGDKERPLGSLTATMGVYAALVAAGGLAVRRSGRGRWPAAVPWGDLVVTTVATHRLSRLLAKDTVTAPLRAPFTRFEGVSGPAELHEEVRGTGPRKALGELITCPFCLAQWVATVFAFGFLVAPRVTRVIAGVFSAVAGADFLQFAYASAQQKVEG